MRVAVLLAVVSCLTGCSSMWAGHVDVAGTGFDAARRGEVFDLAIEELERREFEVETVNREGGYVRTARSERSTRVPCGALTCAHRDRYEVWVTADGAAIAKLTRELAMLAVTPFYVGTTWGPPSRWQKATLEGIASDQLQLVQFITAATR
jgi:hypothetical protein